MKNIEKDFNEETKNKKVVVDFWASWCGPCKMFGPVFEEAESKHCNINFCKFNVDEDINNVCKNLNIMSIPTIILFENGKEIKRNVGFMNNDEFRKFLGDKDV